MLLAGLLGTLPSSCQPEDGPWVRQLRHVAALDDAETRVPLLVLEAGDTALPVLKWQLSRGSKKQKDLAVLGLSYLRGDTAVRLLLETYNRLIEPNDAQSPKSRKLSSAYVRQQLCNAMASRGSTADVIFLVASLRDPDPDVVLSAAYALEVLRETKGLEALDGCADREEERGPAVAQACRWSAAKIRSGPVSYRQFADERTGAIASVFASGVPVDVGDWADWQAGHDWAVSGRWHETTLQSPDHRAKLQLRVYLTEDKRSALVKVDYYCGFLCGAGYESALSRKGGVWTVDSVRLMWLS